MRMPRFSIRSRFLGACFIISLAATATTAGGVFGFLRILRARARESCTRMAGMVAGHAHDCLLSLAGKAKTMAETVGRRSSLSPAADLCWPSDPGGRRMACSWALYDARGRRTAGQRADSMDRALDRLGIGTQELSSRERNRLAEALTGRPCTVLVPDGERIYAVHYQPVPPKDQPTAAVQVAAELSGATSRSPANTAGARAVLRPFDATTSPPRLVTIDGEPFLIVHRPLLFRGRQLGTIVVAVPYGAEARYEQVAIFAILVVAIIAVLTLAGVSFAMTGVVMVPLERLHHYISSHQSGAEVERLCDIPDHEAGAILQAYQEMLDQSQVWADRLMESNKAMRDLLTGAVEALVTTIEAKDRYTAGHSLRVAAMACDVAHELGWDAPETEELRLGALFHDIGKVGINQAILNKPGALTQDELERIREHCVVGARIVSSLPGYGNVVRTILHHHERYDGAGYPMRIAGESIPASARIVAVADVFDALTSERSYRAAHSHDDAIAILEQNRGTMHDPDFLDAFIRVIRLNPKWKGAGTVRGACRSRKQDTPVARHQLAATVENSA